MEGVPKFADWLTDWLTDTQTDFIICPMLLTHWADKNLRHLCSLWRHIVAVTSHDDGKLIESGRRHWHWDCRQQRQRQRHRDMDDQRHHDMDASHFSIWSTVVMIISVTSCSNISHCFSLCRVQRSCNCSVIPLLYLIPAAYLRIFNQVIQFFALTSRQWSFLGILAKTAWFYCKRLQNDGALNFVQFFFWATLYNCCRTVFVYF